MEYFEKKKCFSPHSCNGSSGCKFKFNMKKQKSRRNVLISRRFYHQSSGGCISLLRQGCSVYVQYELSPIWYRLVVIFDKISNIVFIYVLR